MTVVRDHSSSDSESQPSGRGPPGQLARSAFLVRSIIILILAVPVTATYFKLNLPVPIRARLALRLTVTLSIINATDSELPVPDLMTRV